MLHDKQQKKTKNIWRNRELWTREQVIYSEQKKTYKQLENAEIEMQFGS